MLTPWYITGFCDGAAAFTYSRSGGTFILYFSLAQKRDNQQIITEIREFFHSIGKIYQSAHKSPAPNQGLSQAAAVCYRVTKISELKILVDHFDQYPLQSPKKYAAYQIWREMVIYKLEHYRRIDYNRLRLLAERLSCLNLQGRALRGRTGDGQNYQHL